jgi:hypothetical protein
MHCLASTAKEGARLSIRFNALQHALPLTLCARRPPLRIVIEPLTRYCLERIRALVLAPDALGLALVRRLNSLLDQLASSVTRLPSV